MRQYVVNRPEEPAMRRILEQEVFSGEGRILRLAWLGGLTRDEIAVLTWTQVSFEDDRLELADRTVPLEAELRTYLWRLHEAVPSQCPYVLFSERSGDRMQPESISRLARNALDRGGMPAVRLMDLRHDWIIRQLEVLSWPEVSRISGVEVPALQARFAPFVTQRRQPPRQSAGETDEFKLWKILQAEKQSPAGLALWLTWQMGLRAQEIIALTWAQVDLEANCLRLPDREILMSNAIRRLLEETLAQRAAEDDGHVLLTEQSKKPLDLPRLSRLTRAALIRGGMEKVRLVDLRKDENRDSGDFRLLSAVQERGAISRGDAMELLGVSKTAAYARLHRLTEQYRLVRVGGKYYLPGTVVPPEEQGAAVRRYLEQSGFAYRQDLAQVLRIKGKQCSLILRHMVESGELVQEGQKYLLPLKTEVK